MRREWINYAGTPCWGEQYKSAKEVKALTEEQIKSIEHTGICLTEDRKHVVCWYVTESKDALYIVSEYPAKTMARMTDTGETMDALETDKFKRPYSVGYIVPGPIVQYGRVEEEAGAVHVPASMVASTYWIGDGYIHDPDR